MTQATALKAVPACSDDLMLIAVTAVFVATDATVGEIRAYEEALSRQISEDQSKHFAVRRLVAKCAGEEDDMLVKAAFTPTPMPF